jgi:DNA-binding PadR family transcriptional regulator
MKVLTVLEQLILSAVVNLEDEAFGVAIRKKIKAFTGKSIMYGTLYNALDQLLRKGYIRKTEGKQPAGRGVQGRVYYALTPAGRKSLLSTFKLQRTIWANIPDLIKDYESGDIILLGLLDWPG